MSTLSTTPNRDQTLHRAMCHAVEEIERNRAQLYRQLESRRGGDRSALRDRLCRLDRLRAALLGEMGPSRRGGLERINP